MKLFTVIEPSMSGTTNKVLINPFYITKIIEWDNGRSKSQIYLNGGPVTSIFDVRTPEEIEKILEDM